jgi:hypothetical protein
MWRYLLLLLGAFSISGTSAQVTSALSPQVGPAIVNGRIFLIGGGDFSIGGDNFRLGAGAMFSLTEPKVKIMGSGPFRHSISYFGLTAEYVFDLSDVVDFVVEEHEVRAYIMAGIGASQLQYAGLTPLPSTSNVSTSTSYYIFQPGLFYTIADAGVPMQIGLTVRYIQSPTPYQMKPRYFAGANVTYRVMLDYSNWWY